MGDFSCMGFLIRGFFVLGIFFGGFCKQPQFLGFGLDDFSWGDFR